MERITKFRATVLLVVFGLILGLYSLRMHDLQVVGSSDVVRSSSSFTSYYTVKGARGNILDRNGNLMVGNRASYNLVFNNFVFSASQNQNENLLRLVELCQELGIEYIEHFPVTLERPYTYTLSEQSSSWQSYFQSYLSELEVDSDISAIRLMSRLRTIYKIPEEWTEEQARRVIGLHYEMKLRTSSISNLSAYVFLEDAGDRELNAIMELNIPGLDTEVTSVREYKTTYAAHILGYLSKITAQEWPEYQDKDYSMDAMIGRTGLEAAFEEYLHGTDGLLVRTVDRSGNIISEHYDTLPQSGSNVELTIDLKLQMVLEDSMADIYQGLRNGGLNYNDLGEDVQGLAGVVLDAKTGQVLAMASYPTYDPATFLENYSALEQTSGGPLLNRVLHTAYAPGSVYKMVPTIAGIHKGVITSESTIFTAGIYTKYAPPHPMCMVYSRSNGQQIHGEINVSQAISVSCNYFFYEVGDRLNIEDMDAVAKSLGLGEPTGIELYEELGHRANPETKAALYSGSEKAWNYLDQILAAIGQSDNAFTPMQIASYVSALANRGTRYACTLLNRVVSSDYTQVILEQEPEVLSTTAISQEAIGAYLDGMYAVTRTGSASGYFLDWYRSYDIDVCAKTGTAEHGSGGSPHGSFACFAPMEDPEIVVVLYGEKAGQGGYLGQIAMEVMAAYFTPESNSTALIPENRPVPET